MRSFIITVPKCQHSIRDFFWLCFKQKKTCIYLQRYGDMYVHEQIKTWEKNVIASICFFFFSYIFSIEYFIIPALSWSVGSLILNFSLNWAYFCIQLLMLDSTGAIKFSFLSILFNLFFSSKPELSIISISSFADLADLTGNNQKLFGFLEETKAKFYKSLLNRKMCPKIIGSALQSHLARFLSVYLLFCVLMVLFSWWW